METEIDTITWVRDGVEDDRAFIMATWLRGLYYGNSWFNEIDKDVFMKKYHEIISSLLSWPITAIKVCCLKEDPSIILGYSVFSNETLHWVFVKDAWRRMGVAKRLVPPGILVWSHLTQVGRKIKPKHVIFNPFLI